MLILYATQYTMLFHNCGGYYNSLILRALELLPTNGCDSTNVNVLHVKVSFMASDI